VSIDGVKNEISTDIFSEVVTNIFYMQPSLYKIVQLQAGLQLRLSSASEVVTEFLFIVSSEVVTRHFLATSAVANDTFSSCN
jgi:hypothetical protein